MNQLLALAVLGLVLTTSADATCCNLNDGSWNYDIRRNLAPSAFEMAVEMATENDHTISFIQAFGDGNERGTYYIMDSHTFESIQYDLNAKTSYRTFSGETSNDGCNYADVSDIGKLTYKHGSHVIPIANRFLNLENFKFQNNMGENTVYRGIDVTKYTGCTTEGGDTYQLSWYLADSSKWSLEEGDGTAPIAIEVCSSNGISTYNSTMTIVNFHDHLDFSSSTAAYHAIFTPPSDRFCGPDGTNTPSIVQWYSFRGEYVSENEKTATPVTVAYDSVYDLLRYTFLPLGIANATETAWIKDGKTGVKYAIDLIHGDCTAFRIEDHKTDGAPDFNSGGLLLVGPERLKDDKLKKLDYIGVKGCRRLACDVFVMEDDDGYFYEYSFVSDDWAEKNAGLVDVSQYNVLAEVARFAKNEDSSKYDNQGAEVFYFTNDFSYESFGVAEQCYYRDNNQQERLKHRWIRLYFRGDHRTLEDEKNPYLRSALIEAAAAAADVSPMRISGVIFDVFHDQLNVEFIIWAPHHLAPSKTTSLDDAVENLSHEVLGGRFSVTVGTDTRAGYTITADRNTFEACEVQCSSQNGADIKLEYDDGYTMGIQIALYIPDLPPSIDAKLPFPTPWNTTYYIEAYHGYAMGEDGGHGALYVYDRHTAYSVIYNEHTMESIIIKESDGSCDPQMMEFKWDVFPFGYFHNGIPIPMPDVLADMTRYAQHNLRQRGYEWSHGFKTLVYDAQAEVGEIAGLELPFSIPVTLRWHWLDRSFNSEDGRFDRSGPVPISLAAEIVIPEIPGLEAYAGGVANAWATIVNYHNHYPDSRSTFQNTKDPFRELLEVPRGIYCKRIRDFEVPSLPDLPERFMMRTETVVKQPYDYVINSEDYMDYNRSFFRYDVTMHNPSKPGLRAVKQVTLDFEKDMYFVIDHDNRTCDQGKISEAPMDNPVMTHVLLAPYDILNLENLDEEYMGEKPCRDMSCHYWIGKRPIESMKGYSGLFEFWATDLKWSTIGSAIDKQLTFVKIAATITKDSNGEVFLMEELEIYDMKLLGPQDLSVFVAPTADFCRGSGQQQPPKIDIPSSYTYRGEYVIYQTKTVSTFEALYDGTMNTFRYDHAPSPATGEQAAYRSTWLIDQDAGIVLAHDRVADTCIVDLDEFKSGGGIWDLIYPDILEQNVGNYIGVKVCRSKFCETFSQRTDFGSNGYQDLETFFTTPTWDEFNSDNPLQIESSALSRITFNGYKSTGSMDPGMFKAVDVFAFTQDIAQDWDYRWTFSCFKDSDVMHYRISVENSIQDTEYFRSAFVRTIASAADIKPYRIVNPKFKSYSNEIRVVFSMAAPLAPEGQEPTGTPLDKAHDNLMKSELKAILVSQPNLNSQTIDELAVPVNSIDSCDTDCDIDANRPVIYEFDAAVAFGVFFGSFVGGGLIALIALAFVYSHRLRIPVKDVFLSPSQSAPSNPAPVNVSGLSYK